MKLPEKVFPLYDQLKMNSSQSPTFQKICLFCGAVNSSLKYTCSCKGKKWQNEYRSLDLKFNFDELNIQAAKDSFYQYNFQDRESGMLQYYSLPCREYHSSTIPVTGLTPLTELKKVGKRQGFRFFLKNEGSNPSGCFKDRETLMCLLNSRRKGVKKAVIYSSGNAAASAALYAQKLDFHLITFVAGDTYNEKIEYIRRHGSDVVVVGDEQTTFENGFRLFAKLNADGVFANAGYDNWSVRNPFRVQGDKTIAVEIVRQLDKIDGMHMVPDYILVPTANGSCLAGIWKGFQELRELGLVSKLPRMVSVGIRDANPVFKAVESQQITRPVSCDLSNLNPEDEEIGSIILAEEGYDSIQATKAVLDSGGLALTVKGSEISQAMSDLYSIEEDLVKERSLLPEPASLVSIAALDDLKKHADVNNESCIVAIITGHGIKAEEKIREMMSDEDDIMETVEDIIEDKQQKIKGSGKPGRRLQVPASYKKIVEAFQSINHQNSEGI